MILPNFVDFNRKLKSFYAESGENQLNLQILFNQITNTPLKFFFF